MTVDVWNQENTHTCAQNIPRTKDCILKSSFEVIYIYIYIYIYTHTHTHICMYTHISTICNPQMESVSGVQPASTYTQIMNLW